MNKIKNKIYISLIYFIIAIIISIYISFYRLSFIGFLISTITSILCFLGIYVCLNGFFKVRFWLKMIIGFGIITLLLALYFIWAISSLIGFNSADCYNLPAENIFTGETKIYCNYPPWYTIISKNELEKNPLINQIQLNISNN